MSNQDQRPLPDGWRWVKLDEVCVAKTGTRDPREEPDSPFHYVDISSVDNLAKRIVEFKTLVGKDAPSRARQTIKDGDVIVSTTRPNLNAVAVVPPELDDQICSTGFCVLRPTDALDRDCLFAFVQSPEFIDSLSALVKGALYPAVTDRQVRSQLIPLPPLNEQRRIAAILSDQLAAVERARRAAQAQLAAASALPAAYLREVFDDSQQGQVKRLGDILQLRKEVVHPYDKPSGPAVFVGLEHIESGTGIRIGLESVEMSKLTGRKPRFYKGDIVYGYLRPYLNKLWIAEFDGLCSVDQYVYSIDAAQADTVYVAWFMRSPSYLKTAPIDTTPGQLPRIRLEEVAAVEINLPSRNEQQQIVNDLELRLASAQHARQALQAQLGGINQLPAALLRQAFRGEV